MSFELIIGKIEIKDKGLQEIKRLKDEMVEKIKQSSANEV